MWGRLAAEVVASALVVLASFLSGAVQVQLGAASALGSIAAAITLGFAYGIVVWTFGPRGAQITPWITALWGGLGNGPWRWVFGRVGAQMLGAAVAAVAIRLGHGEAAPLVAAATPGATTMLREAAGSFLLVLVALGVGHRRDARVALAVGASACASLFMTGVASAGNPLVVLAVAATGLPARCGFALLGQVLGVGAAVALALCLFPWWRTSAASLLFTPRPPAR